MTFLLYRVWDLAQQNTISRDSVGVLEVDLVC